LRSILVTGDGKSAATAYVVIAVEEEYSLMRALGDRPKNQALIHQDDHAFDRMEVTDDKDLPQVLFFNVDRPTAWLSLSFHPQP
jgi:hypothetical protein